MIGLGMTKLAEAVGADVRTIAGLARIINLIGALARNITRVPFGAGWSSSILRFSPFLSLLEVFGNCLNSLHHACWVKFGPNTGPGCVAIVQVIENPGAVVPGPVPGVGGVI